MSVGVVTNPRLLRLRSGKGPLSVTLVGAGPFTVALVNALANQPAVPRPLELRLLGRDGATLAALDCYARTRLPGPIVASSDHGLLDGADVVLVQLRPGGTWGRIADEQLANGLGVAADESLGLGGLATALRGAPVLRGLARELLVRCPGALVLLLTNPLSTFVAELTAAGLATFGCCELPMLTGQQAASMLGVEPAELVWSYTGLSHRGFLHSMRLEDGSDALPLLVDRLRAGGGQIGGVGHTEIAALGALPMKYHRLLNGAASVAGRAIVVDAARSILRDELVREPRSTPASLSVRPMPWYDLMVGPVLGALAGGAPLRLVLDLAGTDGLVREEWAAVDTIGVRAGPAPQPTPVPEPVAHLVASYEAQEAAWAALLSDPCATSLERAVALDPLVPGHARTAVVAALTPAMHALTDQPVASHWAAR